MIHNDTCVILQLLNPLAVHDAKGLAYRVYSLKLSLFEREVGDFCVL